MYKIFYNDYLLHDLQVPEEYGYYLKNPKLTEEINKVAELTFDIYSTHPNFDRLEKLVPNIIIEKNNKVIFKGRVIKEKQNMDKSKQVTCESVLAFLFDSIQRPFEFQGSPEELLTQFINNHNEQVEEYKQFKIGETTGANLDNNEYINRSSEDYLNTFEAIESRVLNIGGYLYVRYEEDGNYIDWIDDFKDENGYIASAQTIEFGENLVDITVENDGADVYSVIIPLGAEIENEDGTKSRLTIAEVNNGLDYLVNEDALAKYGWIVAPTSETTWDDVTLAENLKTKAQKLLNSEGIMFKSTLELNAIDLSVVNNYETTEKSCVTMKSLNLIDFGKPSYANTDFTFTNDVLELSQSSGSYKGVSWHLLSFFKEHPGEKISFWFEDFDYSNAPSPAVNIQMIKGGVTSYPTLVNNIGTRYTITLPQDFSDVTQYTVRIFVNNSTTSREASLVIKKPMLYFGDKNNPPTYEPYWEKEVETYTSTKIVDSFEVGEYVKAQSTPHGLSKLFLLTKKENPLSNPENMKITLGETKSTLTGIQLGNNQSFKNEINIVKEDYKINEKQTDQKLENIREEIVANTSLIQQLPDQIMSSVSKEYSSKFEEIEESLKTQLTQTSEDWTFQFEKIVQQITNVDGTVNSNYQELIKYIRFKDGTITLGEVNNPLILTLSNDRMSFLQNGVEVAYISNNRLYIYDGEFLNSLKIGRWLFVLRSNGNLSLMYV